MNAQKILHVSHGYFPECGGGTETHVRSVLEKQQEKGMDVSLLHGSFEPREEACIEQRFDQPWPTHVLHRSDSYSDYWDRAHAVDASRVFREFLRSQKPDLVHIHQWIRLSDDLCEIAAQEGIPSLLFLHDLYASCPACFRLRPDDSHCERHLTPDNCRDCVPLRGHESRHEVDLGISLYAENMRNELRKAGRTLAATHATADLVTRGLGLDPDLVGLLPLSRVRRFSQDIASTWKAPGPDEPLRLAFWGLVTRRKGVDVLLEALSELSESRPLDGQIELHVFGGIDTPQLERELKDLAQGLPVHFHGRYEYDQIATLRPHLAVFPSTCFETYGLVLDEAIELGAPSLVTNIGALPERVGDAGFAVPPKDPTALRTLLARVLDEPDLLIHAQTQLTSISPDPDRHHDLLIQEYERAIKSCSTTRPDLPAGPQAEQRLELETLRRSTATASPPLQRGLPED